MMDKLLRLVGTWQGTGDGFFPTIPSFVYRETICFTHDDERNQLHFDQRTMKQSDSGEWVQSHWECGFLFLRDEQVVELCTVHSGGRFEKLIGQIQQNDATLSIQFESDFLGNDARMVGSSRVWTLDKGVFSYEMSMATRTTEQPDLLPHLKAELSQK